MQKTGRKYNPNIPLLQPIVSEILTSTETLLSYLKIVAFLSLVGIWKWNISQFEFSTPSLAKCGGGGAEGCLPLGIS